MHFNKFEQCFVQGLFKIGYVIFAIFFQFSGKFLSCNNVSVSDFKILDLSASSLKLGFSNLLQP